MIATIKGTIIEISKNQIILENNGVGYLINIVPIFGSSISLNQKICLYVKQLFKEDDVSLYGFQTSEQKTWFEYFIKVDGVGAKSAISILNTFSIKEMESAILNRDEKFFTSISGIGSKIAIRIVNEMQKIPAKINLEKGFTISAVETFVKGKSIKIEDAKNELFATELIPELEIKSTKTKNKTDNKTDIAEEEIADYQKIIQESMQAIGKLGFINTNLYKDIRLILNDLEENFKQKIANKEIEGYKILPEDLVAGYLKKIK